MAVAIPGRAERSVGNGEVFGRTGPEVRRPGPASPQAPVRLIEATGAPGIDVCRLVVAAAGLSAGLVLPGALVLWAASNVLGGLGARILAMMP